MISVRNVYKSFGSQVVLDGVSMEIEPGKTTAVVGPSGVGKSVLLKLIMGIMTPDEGEIFIEGENITAARSESRKNEIRRSLGVLFQTAALFDSLTIYENIAFPLLERTRCSAAKPSSPPAAPWWPRPASTPAARPRTSSWSATRTPRTPSR